MVITKEVNSRKKKYSAPALEKGLDILELLASESEGLSLSIIAQKLDRSVGELYRMLAVLEQRGYVAATEDGDKWILTLRLFDLSHKFPPINKLTSSAGPVLQKLSYDTEQSCHLVIYYEGSGHVVAQQDSPSARVLRVRLGAVAPLLGSCSGHVLLAYAGEELRQRMLERCPDYTSKQQTKVMRIISDVLDNGYEMIKSAQVQGVRDIGCPVFDFSGQIAGALIIPFQEYLDGSHPVKIGAALDYLKEAASDLSARMGYSS